MVYKPKGEKKEEAGAQEGETEQPAQQEKSLIYHNPFDFKETKKYKNKWEEWKHGEWRKRAQKTFVTLETEIPEMPEKLTEKPSQEEFNKKKG